MKGVLRADFEARAPTTFLFGIADEAHHMFRLCEKAAHNYENPLVSILKQCLLDSESWVVCSDDAQAEAPWALPLEPTCTLQLVEVVRNSRRIFEACQAFRSGHIESATLVEAGMNGPPLRPFVFPKCSTFANRWKKYASSILDALDRFAVDFPGIPIEGNTGIIVRNFVWAEQLRVELRKSIQTPIQPATSVHNFGQNDAGTNAIILDTVEHFDGMEFLVIIAVGLDHPIRGDTNDVAQCHIYRAITRAHCFVAVVQELIPNGRLAFTALTELDEREPVTAKSRGRLSGYADSTVFDHDSERAFQSFSQNHPIFREAGPLASDGAELSASPPLPSSNDSISVPFQLANNVWQCNGLGSIFLSPEMRSKLWVPPVCRKIPSLDRNVSRLV